MSRLKLVRPEATTNLIPNPSVEKDLTGWVFGIGTPPAAVRSALHQARGAWSMKVTLLDALQQYAGVAFTPTPGATYTATARIYAESIAQAGAIAAWLGGGTNPPVDVVLLPGWNTVELTYVAVDATQLLFLPVYNYKAPHAGGKAGVVYVDAVQIEQKAYATSYCDGDQVGCRWMGVPHASKSSRDAGESSGGREIDIFDDASIGFLYSDLAGVGVPPLQHVTQELAMRDGAILQRVKAAPAVVTISATQRAASLPALHALRRALVDLLRPQSGSSPRPTRLVYSGSGQPMHLDVHYLAGLEGQIRRPSRFERPNVQLVAYDPHWKEANDVGASLATSLAVSANRIITRRDGVWQALGTGADNSIDTIALGTDGKVYVGGIFLNIGGVAANRVAYWDPADNAWHAMGAGLNVRPTWLTRGPDGRIYAVGNFTTPHTRVAVWDPVAGTWAALGTGLNAEGTFAVWGPDGYMYVGGFFTTAGGVAVAGGIARWNGAAWSQVPGNPDLYSGTNEGPYAIVVLPNGKIYVGGLFNVGGGAGFDYMAHYNGVAWSQVAGAPSYPAVLTLGPDGNIYVGGGFTSPTLRIARFSGLQFFGLGEGLNEQPKTIAFDETGELYAGGAFTAAGSLSLSDRIARWNGSVWRPLPVDLPGVGAVVDEIAIHGEDVYVVGAFSGNALAPGRTTVTNPGSADAYPLIRLTGPATLRSIENVTSGQEILFDAYVLQAGEQVIVDLRPGHKSVVSSFRGNVLGEVLAGSDLATFALAPGDNDIGVLASGGTADLFFRPRHWGGE